MSEDLARLMTPSRSVMASSTCRDWRVQDPEGPENTRLVAKERNQANYGPGTAPHTL